MYQLLNGRETIFYTYLGKSVLLERQILWRLGANAIVSKIAFQISINADHSRPGYTYKLFALMNLSMTRCL